VWKIQAKLRDVASLEGHVLLKKLRDALESLRGRFAGRNKEDVEKAISMVRYFILFHIEYTTLFKVGNVISFHLMTREKSSLHCPF